MPEQPIPIRRNPGEEEHERAIAHRARALDALGRGRVGEALVHAVLAVEARIEEATVYIAQQ